MNFGMRLLFHAVSCAVLIAVAPFVIYVKTAEKLDQELKSIEKEKK